MFYSRRVGGRPLLYYDVEDNLHEGEEIISNPQQSQLLNATKISGRTNKGLGIGVFNAISANTYAEIENHAGDIRLELTNPLSNYSVVVLDQNLRNNSYLALVNTNVLRNGHFYDANVTGTNFQLKNKSNSYAISGGTAISQKYHPDSTDIGYKYNLSASKISGQWQYSLSYNEESHDFDINDLGFIRGANERQGQARISYNIYQPFSIFSRANFGARFEYTAYHQPSEFNQFQFSAWNSWTTKSFFNIGMFIWGNPIASHDYFEPRTDDFSQFYEKPANISANLFLRSDPSKTFRWGLESRITKF